ncbi:hypothetical protein ACGF3C_02455 [Micromonospora sp. NPDC047762]|uniref:hypothetical protein n=1 Tax=Micromonospora sp. NPDC047762 TaxID=3364255 RepID=UPI00371D5BCB
MIPVRKPITVPDGRHFYGRWPQQMPSTGEGPYIAALARQIGGTCEVCLPVGRADVATNRVVFEVEPAKQWRTAARQALGYAGQTGLTPAIALFGPADYLRIYLFVRDRLPGLQMWVHRFEWEHTTSRQAAVRKYNPAHELRVA